MSSDIEGRLAPARTPGDKTPELVVPRQDTEPALGRVAAIVADDPVSPKEGADRSTAPS